MLDGLCSGCKRVRLSESAAEALRRTNEQRSFEIHHGVRYLGVSVFLFVVGIATVSGEAQVIRLKPLLVELQLASHASFLIGTQCLLLGLAVLLHALIAEFRLVAPSQPARKNLRGAFLLAQSLLAAGLLAAWFLGWIQVHNI
jgi:hypothetical protein